MVCDSSRLNGTRAREAKPRTRRRWPSRALSMLIQFYQAVMGLHKISVSSCLSIWSLIITIWMALFWIFGCIRRLSRWNSPIGTWEWGWGDDKGMAPTAREPRAERPSLMITKRRRATLLYVYRMTRGKGGERGCLDGRTTQQSQCPRHPCLKITTSQIFEM